MNNDEFIELVESAANYSASLYNGLEKVVDDLREDNVRTGLKSLADAIEGIEWLITAVTGIAAQPPGYTGLETEQASEFFREMVDAAENMDYILLTDLIEYEILPIIDTWGNKLDDILENQK